MNKVIKIEDCPCGSGKTTRMIKNFKEDQKYLVILPMLTEVTRVIESSKVATEGISSKENVIDLSIHHMMKGSIENWCGLAG